MSAEFHAALRALRARRKAVGLTQEQLGNRIGRDQAAISDYERGHNTPSMETLTKLADALGCDVVLVPRDRVLGTEYAWNCHKHTDEQPCLHPGAEDNVRDMVASLADALHPRVYVREVTDWRAES